MNSGLGGDGQGWERCVDGNFGEGKYDPYRGNCLTRRICRETRTRSCAWSGSTVSELMSKITSERKYYDTNDDTTQIGYGSSLESIGHDYG